MQIVNVHDRGDETAAVLRSRGTDACINSNLRDVHQSYTEKIE